MFLRYGDLSLVTFTKNKGGNRAIWAKKYKTSVAGKYTRAGAPLAQTYHWSNIQVKKRHNEYEESELDWKTQLFV